jgi:NAD(P)-dependent dehydrogenase (short-subunit alcohol dehydrogenase family)
MWNLLLHPLLNKIRVSKLVVISGCSRGLGRAMALEFSSRGWRVAGGARTVDVLNELSQKINTDSLFLPLDVTDPESVESFAKQVEDKFGSPDLLVNNAGLINQNAPLTKVSPDEFAAVLSVNLGGIHTMIRSFVPMMEKAGHGVIANFSSYWGQSTAPEVGPYCATKWGVEGLTRSLAQELPSGLAAVAFNPGVINTDMLQSTFGEQAHSYPSPQEWAVDAVNRLEKLSPVDNGKTSNP